MSKLAAEVAASAEEAVQQLRARSGEPLDYSPASLQAIEEILAEASAYYLEIPNHQLDFLVQGVGCYILCVAHRQFGGRFYWHREREQPMLMVGEPERNIAMVTWDKVRGRLQGDVGDHIPYFYEGFAERVATAPAGDSAIFV